MAFTPSITDYLVLIIFVVLSFLSGCVGFLLFCCHTSERHDTAGPSKWRRAVVARARTRHFSPEPFPRSLTIFETILLIVINSFVISSFVLLLTAQLGMFRFRYWCLVFVVFLASVLLYRYFSNSSGAGSITDMNLGPAKSDWIFVLLAVVALFAFNPPSESIHTRDPGGYANIAVKISEVGRLKFKDPDYERFNSPDRERLFLPFSLDQVAHPQVIPGFHLIDASSGELTPRYFHLFPIWLALAFKLWRFSGMFGLNVLLGILSVLILVPLGQRLFGSRAIGFLAAFLLAVNLGQIWIVRSPFSEILAQFLLLSGLWTLSVGMNEAHPGFCRLAGLLFGLALFVRIDSALVLLPLCAFSCITVLGKERDTSLPFPIGSFLVPLAGMAAYATLHTYCFAYPYLETVLNTFRQLSFSLSVVLVLFAGLITLMILAHRRHSLRTFFQINQPVRNRIVIIAFVLLTGFFSYGYFVRPLHPSTNLIPLPFPLTGSVPYYDEISLVRLGWYLSPLGLLLAYLGSVISLYRWIRSGRNVLSPFLLILATFAAFYLYKSRAFPDNYWVIRRYVEVVIPGFLLLISLSLVSLWKTWSPGIRDRRDRRPAWIVLGAAVLVLLTAWPLRKSYPALGHREWANTLHQLENLAGANENADILLLERGQFQDFFSSPLKFLFHKTVYPLASDAPSVGAFENLLNEWSREGKRVSILASEESTSLLSSKYQFVPAGRFRFQTQVVESTYERLPQSMEDLRFAVQLYSLQERTRPADPTAISLNLGYHFGFRATGFYDLELSNEYEPFRWTAGRASVELPELKGSEDALLSMRLRREVPRILDEDPVNIFFKHRLVGEPRLSPRFEVVAFPIPNPLFHGRPKNIIEFSSSTYSPARSGVSDDVRELGFMVHSVKLQLLASVSSDHPYFLDFGAESDELDGNLIGFYPKEPASFRWSQPEAQVVLPRGLSAGSDLKISIRALKSSPDPSFKQSLNVAVNGKAIGRAELLDRWDTFRSYDFLIPREIPRSPQTVISLKVSSPWKPASGDVYSDDWRTLGCAVDWVRISGMD